MDEEQKEIQVTAISILIGALSLIFAIPKSRHYILQKFNFLNSVFDVDSSSLQKKTGVPGLEINLDSGKGSFKEVKDCFFLEFTFFNNTGSKVQISNLRIADASSLLKIHPEADKNINDNSYSLKFIEEIGFFKGCYSKREITIDTNAKVKTGIPLSNEYSENDVKRLIENLKNHNSKPSEVKYFALKYYTKIGASKLFDVEFNY